LRLDQAVAARPIFSDVDADLASRNTDAVGDELLGLAGDEQLRVFD
jgi:hypothetical protein